ncbi:N-alpha-acetyltransferase 30 [Galdieria sulphuraria]|nr:N-alpha-acetyltransferase 30 [Galdieria sulphuraria]
MSDEVETSKDNSDSVFYRSYQGEEDLPYIRALIDKDLSEPYSIFTYRYFLNQWPQLCLLAFFQKDCIGCIVCKMEPSKRNILRGYIAMLAVRQDFRRQGIGMELVKRVIERMKISDCQEVVLETETTNKAALCLYRKLGFIRDKLLERYYLNGNDAFRLKLRLCSIFNS